MNKYTTTCEEKEHNLWEEPLTHYFRPSQYKAHLQYVAQDLEENKASPMFGFDAA